MTTSEGVTSEDDNSQMRPKIDPLKKQVTDFLKNVNQFEDQVQDTISPYYFEGKSLKGFATEEGTD